MNISTGRSASRLAWTPGNSSYRNTGLPKEISIQTVPLLKAAFKHAGLGLSAETTHMLGKVATYLADDPSGKLVISDSQNDANKAGLNSSQARINLVKAYLVTQGIDVSRYVIKGQSANNRLVPRPLGTELIIKLVGNHRIRGEARNSLSAE